MTLQSLDSFSFNQVLFYGRTMPEYIQMFSLEMETLAGKRVLDCSAGPSSFALESKAMSIEVTACDPLYEMDAVAIFEFAQHEMQKCMDKQIQLPHLFDKDMPDLAFRELQLQVIKRFSDDFQVGRVEGRYIPGRLPELPFADRSFDLVLSGNFLFLYSDQSEGGMLVDSPFDYDFHEKSITELCRLSNDEVRLYPIKGPHRAHTSFLDKLIDSLTLSGYKTEIVPVAYRDVKDAHHMLRIKV